MSFDNIGSVVSSSNTNILVELNSIETFENNKDKIKVGKYLLVDDGNLNKIFCMITGIETCEKDKDGSIKLIYLVKLSPLGLLSPSDNGYIFKNGILSIPSPTELVSLPSDDITNSIFSKNSKYNYYVGKLLNNESTSYYANGNSLFSKHLAVVGSTGSGKSCAVAKILQEILGFDNGTNTHKDEQINPHIIIYDLHSEYKSAFELLPNENFKVNNLNVDSLILPYWLMNSSELESLFIESHELNSYNQISIFKRAVILSKQKHNPTISKITYDSPIYFDINEVLNYIKNYNNEVIWKENGNDFGKPMKEDKVAINNPDDEYLLEAYKFVPTSTKGGEKASKGPFNGEFERFINRLENKLNDKRLKFLVESKDSAGNILNTEDFNSILKEIIGYINKNNINILDLSGIPFEVLSIVISLFSRIIFDFSFVYSKIRHSIGLKNNIPYMIVCEEAHNYIPRESGSEYNASRRSIERIAKEGRKYGLSLMVVSQRPSEISETVLAQCNNYLVLKLTNVNDQNYVKKLLPNNDSTLVDNLPNFSSGECLVVGDAFMIPSYLKLDLPNPRPQSDDVAVFNEWNNKWVDINFDEIIEKMKNTENS